MNRSNNVLNSTRLKVIAYGTLSLLLLSACSDQQETIKENPLRPVRTLTVSSPDLNRSHEFTAVVDASRKADLSFKVSGELVEFSVNQGQPVTEGQIIAKLDKRDLKIQLSEAKSSFEVVSESSIVNKSSKLSESSLASPSELSSDKLARFA